MGDENNRGREYQRYSSGRGNVGAGARDGSSSSVNGHNSSTNSNINNNSSSYLNSALLNAEYNYTPKEHNDDTLSLPNDSDQDSSDGEYGDRQLINRPMTSYGATGDDMAELEDLDPSSPRSWAPKEKKKVLVSLSIASFFVAMAQAIYLPNIQEIAEDLDSDFESVVATLTLPLLVMGLMNLVIGPLSDVYGRKKLHMVGLFIFMASSIGCGLSKNVVMLLCFRVLQAVGSAAPTIVGAGTVSDVYIVKDRGRALALFLLGPLVGPVLGPLTGGVLSASIGWEGVFYFLAVSSGLLFLISIFTVKETLYLPLAEKPKFPNPLKPLAYLKYYEISSLMVILAIGFAAFFTTNVHFPLVLQKSFFENDPNASTKVGLCYLPLGGGLLLGAVIGGRSADRLRRRGGTPEHRLLPSLIFMPMNGLVLLGQGFIFSWAIANADGTVKNIWAVLLISFLFGFTLVVYRPGTNTYTIEKLKKYLKEDVASSATGLLFFFMLPIAAIISQLSVTLVNAHNDHRYVYGYLFGSLGGLVFLGTFPIFPFIRREIRKVKGASSTEKKSLLNGDPTNIQ